MSIQKLSASLAEQLEVIKGEKGSISADDAKAILDKLINTFNPGGSAAEKFLCDEITNIARHIEATKSEILALSPSSANPHIGTAAIQLDAVVKATEEAAHTIMDAADKIQEVVGASKSADDALKNEITEITGTIYEACNFQDLTGQRIKKVMNALDFTESKIQRLIALFSSDGTIKPQALPTTPANENDGLLDGPQLPGHAPTQAEIDAMFGNLK